MTDACANVCADVEVRGEPNCDMCLLRDGKGRIEEERENGYWVYVCDTCGWIMDIVFDEEDDELHCPEKPILRVNLIEAAKLR